MSLSKPTLTTLPKLTQPSISSHLPVNSMPAVPADYPLAKTVIVRSTQRIDGADRVVLYEIDGWQLVGAIDQFQPGEMAIYFCIGTVFPDDFEHDVNFQGQVLKSKKIRGKLSQGLLAPISWLVVQSKGMYGADITAGLDVTELFGLKKWVPESEADLYNNHPETHNFPIFVPKTDEPRIQNDIEKAKSLVGRQICITSKFDGTSTTFVYNDGIFSIYGRNCRATRGHYLDIAKKHEMEEKMSLIKRNLAIQGEITGPKINGGRHKTKNDQFHVFNVFDINTQKYLNWDDVIDICGVLGLETVPVIFRGVMDEQLLDYKHFLEMAEAHRYEGNIPAEGIVIKSDDAGERISFKAISNSYAMKHNH